MYSIWSWIHRAQVIFKLHKKHCIGTGTALKYNVQVLYYLTSLVEILYLLCGFSLIVCLIYNQMNCYYTDRDRERIRAPSEDVVAEPEQNLVSVFLPL